MIVYNHVRLFYERRCQLDFIISEIARRWIISIHTQNLLIIAFRCCTDSVLPKTPYYLYNRRALSSVLCYCATPLD